MECEDDLSDGDPPLWSLSFLLQEMRSESGSGGNL